MNTMVMAADPPTLEHSRRRRDHLPGEATAVVLVPSLRSRRWLLAAAVAAVGLSAGVLHAALPPGADVSGPTSLAGQLLIATPQLKDPRFDHAVILIAEHSRQGALGLVINKPGNEFPVAGLLAALGVDQSGVTRSVRVFVGGPVSPEAGFVIHSAEYHLPDTIDIDGRVALSTAADALRDIGLGKGPRKSLVVFGYAGWASLQLEEEVAHGAWFTVPEDPTLVFDDDRAKVWADALARHNSDR